MMTALGAGMGGPHTTTVEIRGPVACIKIRITGHLKCRQRRAIALAFFRQIRPLLEYFRGGSVRHWEGSTDFRRLDERGVTLFKSSTVLSSAGRLGFQLRMRRLELGMSLRELALKLQMSADQISRIERGLCRPYRSTIERMEVALQFKLPRIQDVDDVEIAQGVKVRPDPSKPTFPVF